MAYNFGDGFDLYAAPADMANGYWDAGGLQDVSLIAGRFSGSRGIAQTNSNEVNLVKNSGVNDAVHHLVVAFQQNTTITGTSKASYFQLLDGTTGQCCIVFRSDGAILLTSGTPAGAVLATYAGAFPVTSTWYAFEFEVVINNTTGSFTVRKNGNNTNDFTATALNTRVSANNYANKLQVGVGPTGVNTQIMDDLFWQSGAATGTWLGDIRCYTRMPASDQSVQFSRSPSTTTQTPWGASGTSTAGTNIAIYTPFTAPYSGPLTGCAVNFNNAYTGNLKCALFAAIGAPGSDQPGAVIQSATAVAANPGAGYAAFTFSPSISVVQGVRYFVGVCADTNTATLVGAGGASRACWSGATTYAAWPVSNPTSLTFAASFQFTYTFSTTLNYQMINEAQQDGLTSYVYDNVSGHADFYGIGSLGVTPAAIIATTLRAYAQKSDAGGRILAAQVKSGAATVASAPLVLTPSGFQWAWRTDVVDPNTGAGWTQSALDAAQIGPAIQ